MKDKGVEWSPMWTGAETSTTGPMLVEPPYIGSHKAGMSKQLGCYWIVGPSANARENSGAPPLHDAVYGRHLNMVRLLLERGADPRIEGHSSGYGQITPALLAEKRGYKEIAQFLREAGARVAQGKPITPTAPPTVSSPAPSPVSPVPPQIY
jgi:hypothetical protein